MSKNTTDISQSKKLVEILPLESADMIYTMTNGYHTPFIRIETIQEMDKDDVCAWSLAALLEFLPEYNLQRTDWGNKTEYKIVVTVNEDNYASKNYDNPLDACYELILKLNELKML